ncbi:hypothetical protein [Acinetobacter sp.]|uniref:hypothetical protein n=1 Tax=Acinetobacter sp. TaxID=472 RepID=UPI00388E2260
MSKQDGFTGLPNFICDEGYLAVLDGEAVKCLVFLNRHIKGFHLDSKGMSETLVKKITGIKDGRTVQKYMSQLSKYKLIKIEKSKGKSNIYFLTFDERLPTQHVGALKVPTSNVPTQHVGTPPTQDAGTTTYMTCGSVKEIDLKENLNKKEKGLSAENFEDELFSEYLTEQTNPISLKSLSRIQVSLPADLRAQAKKINPELSDDLITAEIKGFAQWSLTRNPVTPQTWMNYWIRRIQNLKVAHSPKLKPQVNPKQPQAKKFTGLSDSQCNVFASKICADDNFASQYAEIGETQKQFVSRITEKLKDPAQVLEWADYLRAVGFEGNLGEQA